MRMLLILLLISLAGSARALGKDDVIIYGADLDKLEVHDGEKGEPLVWEGGLSASGDIWGLHLTSEGERLDGETEEGELQLRLRRALTAFWNLEFGWRRDFAPTPKRDWAALAVEGALPYHIETELSGYLDDDGNTGLRLEAHYELLLTQRLVLQPEVELNAWGQEDLSRGQGKGLSELEAGLRLRYELHRKFAPYLGVEHKRFFGDTADLRRRSDADVHDTVLVGGLRLWY